MGKTSEAKGIYSCFAFNHFIEKVFRFVFEHNIQYNTIHCVKHLLTRLQQLADMNIFLTKENPVFHADSAKSG